MISCYYFIFYLNSINLNSNPIRLIKLESKVNTSMKRLFKKSRFKKFGRVAHIHPDYLFSNVGHILLEGKKE
jgi:hypothetical protein